MWESFLPLKAIKHIESLCESLCRLLKLLNVFGPIESLLPLKAINHVGSLCGSSCCLLINAIKHIDPYLRVRVAS